MNEDNIYSYAPVIIPTLCRYSHFKRCIESLSQCTGAEHTDVYIGLDYPAKDEHWTGYNKINDYLNSCGKLGFQNLIVIRREKNFGLGETGNFAMLKQFVFAKYDRLIASEDDNEFSPCFLEYINKGLALFEDDKSVIAINGYRHFYPFKFVCNTFFRQNVYFSAWGYGIWRDRQVEFINKISPAYFRENLNWSSFWLVKKNGNNRLSRFLYECNQNTITRNDETISVMMAIEHLDVIMPKESLVRNIGWDGSGINCNPKQSKLYYNTARKHLFQLISKDKSFEYIGTGKEYYSENKAIYVENFIGRQNVFELFFTILKYLIKRLLKWYLFVFILFIGS